MAAKLKSTERYELIIFEKFEYKGQKRHKVHRVGSATASSKGGYVLYIPVGIALTGRVMMVPEKTPFNELDLLDAYHSAAEEYGA